MCLYDLSSAELVSLASALALIIADDLTSEQIGILGDFFSALGTNLSLISDTSN